jgi:hypothetical protein
MDSLALLDRLHGVETVQLTRFGKHILEYTSESEFLGLVPLLEKGPSLTCGLIALRIIQLSHMLELTVPSLSLSLLLQLLSKKSKQS